MSDGILKKLERLEAMLVVLVDRAAVREWYSIEEFARIVGRSEFTTREWCRLGRIHAEKKESGRGAYASWVISHAELLRFQREGLLPLPRTGAVSEFLRFETQDGETRRKEADN